MERELNKLFNDTNYNKENVIIRKIWSIKLELQDFFWGVYIGKFWRCSIVCPYPSLTCGSGGGGGLGSCEEQSLCCNHLSRENCHTSPKPRENRNRSGCKSIRRGRSKFQWGEGGGGVRIIILRGLGGGRRGKWCALLGSATDEPHFRGLFLFTKHKYFW